MSEPQTPLRFCVVGCGRIAQTHLEALAAVDCATLAAVAEPRTEAGLAAVERFGGRHFADALDPTIIDLADAVVIAAPPAYHANLARHFLERGVHVLCEKPLTVGSSDAADLLAVARRTERVLMMASKFRYVDDVIQAKALLASGGLGDVVLYDNAFCGRVGMADRWNADPEIGGGGVLIDNGSHSVDIARYLLGPLAAVQAQRGLSTQGLPVEATARLQFRTATGALGSVDLSWSLAKGTEHYIGVYGTGGTLLVGWKGSRYQQEGSAGWQTFGTGYSKQAAFEAQLRNFVGTVRGTERPLITPEDALASVLAVEAAYRSADSGRWVEVQYPAVGGDA